MKRVKEMGKRILAGILAAFLLSPALTAAAQGVTGILVDRADHSDLKFEEYEYVRLKESDFDAIVDGLEKLAEDASNSGQVMEKIIAMEDYSNEMSCYYTIAHIRTTLDANNKEYEDELKYYDELAVNVGDKVMLNYKLVAVSPCSDALYEHVDDEDDWQDILDYEPMTQEQKDLRAQEKDLELQYDDLYNEKYTSVIGGDEYTSEDLETAYSSGDISFDEYMGALADITTKRNKALGELYLELVDVRTKLARSYDYDNYADYAYDKVYDRDYKPEDLKNYRRQVKDYLLPLWDEIYNHLYVDYADQYMKIRDQKITEEECLELLGKYLPEISEDMMVPYNYMVEHNLCDLKQDEKKAPGGYTTSIQKYNAPYMFNCASGDYSDMNTLIHEFGHYNQMYYASEDAWYYGSNDLDLAEINSQGLEVLFMKYADDIFGDYGQVMLTYNAFNQVYAAVEGCKEDAFQYEVYKNADSLTLDKVNEYYYNCCKEYDDYEFYNSYYLGMYGLTEQDQVYEWVEVPHTFQSPMYYISYSVSMAAVEELRDIILKDREEGIEVYLKLAQAGADDSFQETLEKYGVNNPIENPRFKEYADNIRFSLGLIDSVSGPATQPADDLADVDPSDAFLDDTVDPDDDDTVMDFPYSNDYDDDLDSWYSGGRSSSTALLVVLGIIGFILLSVIILMVILIVVKNKKNKNQAAPAAGGQNKNGTQGTGAYGASGSGQNYSQPGPGMRPGGMGANAAQNYSQPGPGMQPGGMGANAGQNYSQPGPGMQPGGMGANAGQNYGQPGLGMPPSGIGSVPGQNYNQLGTGMPPTSMGPNADQNYGQPGLGMPPAGMGPNAGQNYGQPGFRMPPGGMGPNAGQSYGQPGLGMPPAGMGPNAGQTYGQSESGMPSGAMNPNPEQDYSQPGAGTPGGAVSLNKPDSTNE